MAMCSSSTTGSCGSDGTAVSNDQGLVHRLEQAITLAEGGQKEEAEALLRTLVAEGTRLPKAAMALGVLSGERGDRAERRLWLQQARRLEEASGEPLTLRLLLNLLVDALEQDEPEQALAYGNEALALYRGDGEVHLQVARVHSVLEKPDDAKRHLEMACAGLRARLSDHPEEEKAWRLLALAEQSAERLDEAIEAYGRALALDPNHLPSLLAISRLLMARGQADEAMPWLLNALAVAPDDPVVLTLNGDALNEISGPGEAIPILREALKANPAYKEASVSLSRCLYHSGLFVEASEVLAEALETCPGDLELRMGMASTLRNMGKLDEAITLYREILEEAPGNQTVFNNLMFTYSINGQINPETALETARQFWNGKKVHSEGRKPSKTISLGAHSALKVGLLSADIGNHVVGRFLDPLLRYHDRDRFQLELISMRRTYESRSEELISLADNFFSLEGFPIAQAQEILKQQNYDLIVDTSGYTNGSGLHLLADRCAPVQAHYIGYHATTGLSTIDWFIGDEETADSELQDQFSERLWRLPRPWLAYPSQFLFPKATSYMEGEQLILGCFCQASKLSEATLEIWDKVFKRIPDALLVLKGNGLQDKGVREFIGNRLQNHGIAMERIRLIPPVSEWSEHLDFYNLLDIALDTTPWSSATTGFEALGMGVPLVALRGDRMAARMSSSLVKGLGHHEWVAHSAEEAAEIIESLGRSPTKQRDNKKRLQEEALVSVLWDGFGLCKKLEQAFAEMCD